MRKSTLIFATKSQPLEDAQKIFAFEIPFQPINPLTDQLFSVFLFLVFTSYVIFANNFSA
jgi:hypothetical protein